jgi:hypothetical protein
MPARPDVEIERFARGGERGEPADRGRIVDDAVQAAIESEQIAQPREHDVFEFGRGGRRAPEHRVDVERGNQRLGDHGDRARADCEIREKARVVPVGDAGQNEALEIVEDRIEGLAFFGRPLGERPDEVAGIRERERTGYRRGSL